MNIDTILQYAPKAATILASLGLLYAIRRYNQKNDGTSWLRHIYASAEKAAKDEQYRQNELADANTQIAQYPTPNPIEPITEKQQRRLGFFPKMMFMTGLSAVVCIYLGLFSDDPTAATWALLSGFGFLALTALFYWSAEKTRPYVRRVQELNRKYLLLKAGKDEERFATLREIMAYYPTVAELWLEMGDQHAVAGRLDDAVASVKKARALSPGHIDLPLVEASFHLRRQDAQAAEDALDVAENLKKAPSDPRIAVYRGAAALQKKDKETAAQQGKEALTLDRSFTEKLLEKDPGLKDFAAFLEQTPG